MKNSLKDCFVMPLSDQVLLFVKTLSRVLKKFWSIFGRSMDHVEITKLYMASKMACLCKKWQLKLVYYQIFRSISQLSGLHVWSNFLFWNKKNFTKYFIVPVFPKRYYVMSKYMLMCVLCYAINKNYFNQLLHLS